MKGVREDVHGYQAFVKVKGRFISKRFPKDTPLHVMREWRVQARARAILDVPPPAGAAFEDDVKDYLKAVSGMPTLAWRETDLVRWQSLFAGRPRSTITAVEIRTHLERWRQTYAASTVNHRRTALMHLWTVLDGKSAPSPVKDVPRYREAHRSPRALPPALITAILKEMPESVTKARLELMAWTGLPHAILMRLEPSDINWGTAVYIRPRRKGEGVEGRWIPLLPQGWKALKQFKKMGAWGKFSTSSLRTSFRLAAGKVGLTDVTPYDLRHAFLTLVALASKDDRVVAQLGMHKDERMSRRYTAASVDPRVLAGLKATGRLATLATKRRKKATTSVDKRTAKAS